MKNIKVLEYGRLDKESMEMITGGSLPEGSDCAPAGCALVTGTHYFHGECYTYTQCGYHYLNCSSEKKYWNGPYEQCAGGSDPNDWYQRKEVSTFVLA